jgi:nuclear pore complex protein Nup160
MYQIPEADFDPSAKRVDIVTLQEVQKDYAIALARLQLSSSFPEFGQTSESLSLYSDDGADGRRADFVLEPDVVVALLVQTSQFDLAFSAALTLDVDMSSLLEQVTEKCAELSYQGAAYVHFRSKREPD